MVVSVALEVCWKLIPVSFRVTARKYCRINPFCSSNGGGFHDSDIESDVNSATVRFVGGDVGAESEARGKRA